VVTYEAIRKWCSKFGQQYANQLRRRRPRPGDKWHLDEMVLTIKGERHHLWRAVDQAGNILDILVQRRRDKRAAKKFFRKLLKGLAYVPRVIITDKLKSSGAAKREILPGVEHRQHRYLNNRAENSHQPTRQRGICQYSPQNFTWPRPVVLLESFAPLQLVPDAAFGASSDRSLDARGTVVSLHLVPGFA
jgi:transposase-like protein